MRNRLKLSLAMVLVAQVFFGAKAHASEVAASKEDEAPSDPIVIDAHMNVAGPLQFGLTPTVEVGTNHWAGLAYFRWLDSGLYARSALPNRADQELAFSYGLGAGGRYYHRPGLSGFNAGLGIEYLHVVVESELEKEAFVTSWLVPQLGAGYRFRFGRFLLGLGVTGGYAFSVSARTDDLSAGADPVIFTADDSGRPFASASVDLGFYF